MAEPEASPAAVGGLTRRTVLKLAVTGTLGAALGAGSGALVAHRPQPPAPRYRFFTEAEAALLIPICEQIIPRDDTPGATDAGVIHYIDRQVSSVLSRHQQTYRQGLAAFRQTCLQVFKQPFEQLPFDTQTEALRQLEAGKAPKELWREPSAKVFFNLVCDHTMQGFYGSPRHGGNRDYASYRMLGLAYPNLIGQNRYAPPPRG